MLHARIPGRKWLLAALAAVVIAGGIGFAQWWRVSAVESGIWQDNCASVPENTLSRSAWIMVTDDSPQGVGRLLADTPTFSPNPSVALTPGMPIQVHPVHERTGVDVNDCPHWLLPEYDATGRMAALADYAYDYPHHRIRFVESGQIMPSDPRYRNSFPYLSSAQAVALLQQARGVGARPDPAPELVFLGVDVGLPEKPGPAAWWSGGGVVAPDPVWMVAGADGQTYIVGTDKHVYSIQEVPFS
jgi:hypothetical protein